MPLIMCIQKQDKQLLSLNVGNQYSYLGKTHKMNDK